MPLVAEKAGIWHWWPVNSWATSVFAVFLGHQPLNGWWPQKTVKTLVAHTRAFGGPGIFLCSWADMGFKEPFLA